MTTRRDAIKTAAATGIAMATAGKAAWTKSSPLSWQSFLTGESGFFRAPVLLSGQHDALLIDGGFTLPDGRALAKSNWPKYLPQL